MRDVGYFAPKTLADALAYYKDNLDATLFAGGTDILVGMEAGKVHPKKILDLKALTHELSYIKEKDENFHIGALTTILELERNERFINRFPFVVKAASVLGSWQIRTSATVGGNICNGAPSAELTPSWLVLSAKICIATQKGEDKIIPVEEFLLGPGKVNLEKGEILKEIIIPHQDTRLVGGYGYRKLRRSMDVAVVNMACSMVINREGIVEQAKIALGAVCPVAFRAKKAEDALNGKKLTDELIEEVAEICAQLAKPIDDVRSTAEYRREMVRVYTIEILNEAGRA